MLRSRSSSCMLSVLTVRCWQCRYVPKRRVSSTAAPPQSAVHSETSDVGNISAASYMPEKHAWAEDEPLPVVSGSWHKAEC